MARLFPRFLGETQLREHARHPGLACAKQSQRSAKNPVPVGLEGRARRRDQGSCAAGVLRRSARLLRSCGAEANRWERYSSAYRLADAATERRACAVAGLFLLRWPTPSRLWLGMGSFFGTLEQSQEGQLAMPVLCSTALLFRRRLSASGHRVSRFRELAAPRLVASLRVHLTPSGGGWAICLELRVSPDWRVSRSRS